MRAKVIVDADACPRTCLEILKASQKDFNFRLITVASFNHQIDSPEHIVVGSGADAADFAIVNLVIAGDLVITHDLGLAALVLAKGAKALAPSGKVYSASSIDFWLEERALKAKLRRSGSRIKGPAARSYEDDMRFRESLYQILAALE